MASQPSPKADIQLHVQAAAVVHPGDTLLLAIPDQSVTAAQARQLANIVESGLPGVSVRVLVGVSAFAVYEPGRPAEATEGSDGHA
jgi:hypothetical protein